ncbi:MAG: S41 family peptidase [Clostridia bacterium]|nr:S41 family peptidase [Clostridia bacterium]
MENQEIDQNTEISEQISEQTTEQTLEQTSEQTSTSEQANDLCQPPKKSKSVSILVLVVSLILTALITFETTYLIMSSDFNREKAELADEYNQMLEDKYEDMEVFKSVIELYNALPEDNRNIELYKKLAMIDYYYRNVYANEIDEEKLIYGVMNGYVAGAEDRYGEYYTADDFETLTQENEGNTVGIGVYVNYNEEHNAIKILSVMKDSPAQKAGILVGDIVIEVNGESVSEMGYYVALDKVKGEEGTTVELTLLRNGEQIQVTATRNKVETETIFYHQYEYDKTVGVIRIVEFNNAVPEQFKNAITDLKSKGVTSLVFDVRNNPGGTLTSVVEMLDYLLPQGDLVYVTDAKGNVLKTHKSDASCLTGIDSMAVLVNENTASAAELFACALRDYNKAILVGTKTYGKGSMQTIYMLPDGTGLRLTTNKYNPPKTPNYDGIGLTPDITVELSEALNGKSHFEYTDSEDNQLQSAYNGMKSKQ